MRFELPRMFEVLLDASASDVVASITTSSSASPRLGSLLADLDPQLSLDWRDESFLGQRLLRERIAAATGLPSPDEIAVTAGTAEANFLALAQLLRPGDELVTETPGWHQPRSLAPGLGATVTAVRRREESGWSLDIDELVATIQPRTTVVFLSNPHNPTGRVLDTAELATVARRVEEVGAWLVVDEVYAGLEWEGPRVTPIASLSERGISTGSVSKTLGLQGLRVGWLACADADVRNAALVLRESTSEIPNVVGEALAEIALRPERLGPALASARDDGRRNLDALDAFVRSRPELDWTWPDGGLVGVCRVRGASGDDVARRLLAPPHRTFLIPGSAFDLPEHVRLGAGGGAEANLLHGLERFGMLLDEMQAEG